MMSTGNMPNNPPRGPLGILGDDNGVADVGVVLTARPNAVKDDDGIDHNTWTFQWTRNRNPIAGATGPTYTVTEEDKGYRIGLRGQYLDGDGNQETVISESVTVADKVTDAIAAIYTLVMDRDEDEAGAAFYEGHFRNGVPLSVLVKDMEDNKAKGAK